MPASPNWVPSYHAAFDECGEEGFSFSPEPGKGSSEWFILAAAIHRNTDREAIRSHFESFKQDYSRPANWHFHLRNASHEDRLGFIQHMTALPYVCMAVIIHKPSLQKLEAFRGDYRLYFYAAKFLIERISWYCRDNDYSYENYDGSLRLTFSSRRGLTEEKVQNYLDMLRSKSASIAGLELGKNGIHWPILETAPNISKNKKSVSLQLADCLASSIGKALETNKFGHTECRYIRNLRPLLYERFGTYRGYGLKFFPALTSPLEDEPRMTWLSEFR